MKEKLDPRFKLSQIQHIEQLNSIAKLRRDFALSLVKEHSDSTENSDLAEGIRNSYRKATASVREFNEVIDNSTDSLFIYRQYLEKVIPAFNSLITEYDKVIVKFVGMKPKSGVIDLDEAPLKPERKVSNNEKVSVIKAEDINRVVIRMTKMTKEMSGIERRIYNKEINIIKELDENIRNNANETQPRVHNTNEG